MVGALYRGPSLDLPFSWGFRLAALDELHPFRQAAACKMRLGRFAPRCDGFRYGKAGPVDGWLEQKVPHVRWGECVCRLHVCFAS